MPPERLALLDAPSNLGLSPPGPGSVPGVYKLAGALRDQGLLERLGADDGGVVVPPRYVDDWRPGAGVRNAAALECYSRRLADRVGAILERPAAGEDLALVTGRGDRLADLEGRGPLVADGDVVAIGMRAGDSALVELRTAGIEAITASELRERDAPAVAGQAIAELSPAGVDGAWIHCDVDVLDPALMPAVDSPSPGGLGYAELTILLRELLASDLAVGMQVTIYDPDLDEQATFAPRLVDCLVEVFDA